MDEVLNAVSTVGFPIVCCFVMMYYVNIQTKLHKEEVDKIVTSLNENTTAVKLMNQRILDMDGNKEENG